MTDLSSEPRRRPGRPSNAERMARADPDRPSRELTGRATVEGRNGEILSRTKNKKETDDFFIPREIIPGGWEYQWNVVTVTGESQNKMRLAMAAQGWRPVPAERHDGMFMSPGHKGAIERDGLILEERPRELCDEARDEEYHKAIAQVNDQNAHMGPTRKSLRLPGGFSDDTGRYKGVGERIGRSVEYPADAPRPQLPIDGGE